MKLSEIEDMWAEDSKVDLSTLDANSLVDPMIFKYHKILSAERIKFRAMGEKKKLLTQTLDDYYNGKIDGRDIGREPWQLNSGTKGSTEKRIEVDKEMIDFNLTMFAQEEKVLLLKEIIQALHNRSFGIGNAIKFMAFMRGDSL